jgi:hypothetical protein
MAKEKEDLVVKSASKKSKDFIFGFMFINREVSC